MKDLYIIDGYNIIFAWKDLQTLADESLEHARQRLIDTIAGYGKIKGVEAVIVFDAMYTDEGAKEESVGKDCRIVFTDKDETADSRIERLVYEHRRERRGLFVATSDGTEQQQILGSGAYRVSARELAEDVARMKHEEKRYVHSEVHLPGGRNEVVHRVKNTDVWEKLEKIRRSK